VAARTVRARRGRRHPRPRRAARASLPGNAATIHPGPQAYATKLERLAESPKLWHLLGVNGFWISEILAAGRATSENALEERLSRAVDDGDLPGGVDTRALARFVMTLSEGFAVHAAAGASRDDLQASVDIAMRAVAALYSCSEEQRRGAAPTAGATVAASG
jgi:hypothetical protein